MNCYAVKYKSPAENFIRKNKAVGIRFLKAFDDLSKDYIASFSNYDIKKMKSTLDNLYRLRIGKYRAIFQIKNNELIILVFDIDSRGDIYK